MQALQLHARASCRSRSRAAPGPAPRPPAHDATATAQAASDGRARDFVAGGPHRLLIGGERGRGRRRPHLRDRRPGDRRGDLRGRPGRRRRRRRGRSRPRRRRSTGRFARSTRPSARRSCTRWPSSSRRTATSLPSSSRSTTASRWRRPGGDVAATVNHLRYYAGWPTKIEGETIPVSARDVLCYTLREPVGVCAQIVPWNFPLLMATWKIAPGARRRLPDRPEAGRADAADRPAPRRAGPRGRLPARAR